MQSRQDSSSVTLPDTPAFLRLAEIRAFGTDHGRGNLLGIQPFMESTDYLSEVAFAAKIGGYLAVALDQGWIGPQTVVVLPEMLGSWLVIANEDASTAHAPTLAAAMQILTRRHALALLTRVPFAREKSRRAASIFRIKAQRMATIYMRVFGTLAETYQATIVAGSLVLPDPQIENGVLKAGRGPLYNTTPVFQPDGTVHQQLVRKVVPTEQELPLVTAGRQTDLPVFETPAGKLGVLICADSWFPDLYQVLQQGGAELLAVPSYLAPDDSWDQVWEGYNGAANPADIDPAHIGQLTEGQAWLTYALAGRAGLANIQHGINVFMRGRLWDLGADGHTVLRRGAEVDQGEHQDGAALINCWIE